MSEPNDTESTPPQANLKPRFFGKVTASVSHEIQNVLAIVKENAGLMEDLIRMALHSEQDIPLERLVSCLETIKKQATRGTGLTANLNGFAHTPDYDVQEVDIVDLTRRLIALTGRLAENVGIRVSIGPSDAPMPLMTDPVQLQATLHLIQESLFSILPSGAEIVFDFHSAPSPGKRAQVSIMVTHQKDLVVENLPVIPNLHSELPKQPNWNTLREALSPIQGEIETTGSSISLVLCQS